MQLVKDQKQIGSADRKTAVVVWSELNTIFGLVFLLFSAPLVKRSLDSYLIDQWVFRLQQVSQPTTVAVATLLLYDHLRCLVPRNSPSRPTAT